MKGKVKEMIKKSIVDRKNMLIKITIFIWGVISIAFVGQIITQMDGLSNFKMTVEFIRAVNILLGIITLCCCYVLYKKWQDSVMYIVLLLYTTLVVSIIFGFVDYKIFYDNNFNSANYLFLSILPLKIFLMGVLVFRGNLYKLIIKNKILFFNIVVLLTVIVGIVDSKVSLNQNEEVVNSYIISGLLLSAGYIISSIRFIKDSIHNNKVIYSFIGGSLFLLGIKCFYLALNLDYSIFSMKLTAVFITYLSFFIVIIGVGVEIYFSNEEKQSLNIELAKFHSLVDNNKNTNIFICDNTMKISYMNKRLINQLKRRNALKDYEKHLKSKYLSSEDGREIHDELKRNGVWRERVYYKEEKRTLDCNAQIISENNDRYEILVSFTDISERVNLENEIRERKLNATKEAIFISNLSHELRTPLNIFYSTIQLMDSYKDSEEFKSIYNKHSGAMKLNVKRMLRLINNIIDTSKINLGALSCDFKNYEIVSLVEDISLSAVNYGKAKDIYIEFDTELEECYIRCDANMIEKILLNLISNSIKYSHPNSTIYINLSFTEDYVEIDVRDNGIGMKQDDIEEIFNRFSRCDNSFKRLNEGSGIGLSVVKSLVERHEGIIEVESIENEGSTFIIKLPRKIIKGEAFEIYRFNESTTELELSDIY
ncbi:MAG: ATP-binding protein [Clostridium sp.]